MTTRTRTTLAATMLAASIGWCIGCQHHAASTQASIHPHPPVASAGATNTPAHPVALTMPAPQPAATKPASVVTARTRAAPLAPLPAKHLAHARHASTEHVAKPSSA